MVLMPIHAALWWHAKQAVSLAAEEAVDAAQVEGGTAADGEAGAMAILSAAGNVEDIAIDVDIDGELVTVVVRGRSSWRLFPGNWGVEAIAQGRVERFIPENERTP